MGRRLNSGRNNKVFAGFNDCSRDNVEFQANIAPRRKTRQDGEARNVGNEGMRMLYPDDDEAELREARVCQVNCV